MKHLKPFNLFESEKIGAYIEVPDVENFKEFWSQQVGQYPKKGEAGISYFKGEVGDKWVDCLLYRNKAGKLIGVLNHYPFNFPPYEEKGNINVMVDPKEQSHGTGKILFREALKRWKDIDLHKQKWTPSGMKMLGSYLKSNR